MARIGRLNPVLADILRRATNITAASEALPKFTPKPVKKKLGRPAKKPGKPLTPLQSLTLPPPPRRDDAPLVFSDTTTGRLATSARIYLARVLNRQSSVSSSDTSTLRVETP